MMCMSGDNLFVYKHPVSNEKVTGQNHSKNNRLPKRFLKTRQRERGQSHESTFKMKMNTTANSDKSKFFTTTTETSQNSSKCSQLTTDHDECIDLFIRPL